MIANGSNNTFSTGTADPQDIYSVISGDATVDGDIVAREDLRIEGTVKGSIRTTGAVVVESTGVVASGIKAEWILIRGRVSGDVEATGRVEIDGSGRLQGNCTAASIRINEGAVFEGRSDIRKLP
ncbi:MAG: polymer-forming cytoskeletal protein [Desulfobacterales bacterium]